MVIIMDHEKILVQRVALLKSQIKVNTDDWNKILDAFSDVLNLDRSFMKLEMENVLLKSLKS